MKQLAYCQKVQSVADQAIALIDPLTLHPADDRRQVGPPSCHPDWRLPFRQEGKAKAEKPAVPNNNERRRRTNERYGDVSPTEKIAPYLLTVCQQIRPQLKTSRPAILVSNT